MVSPIFTPTTQLMSWLLQLYCDNSFLCQVLKDTRSVSYLALFSLSVFFRLLLVALRTAATAAASALATLVSSVLAAGFGMMVKSAFTLTVVGY